MWKKIVSEITEKAIGVVLICIFIFAVAYYKEKEAEKLSNSLNNDKEAGTNDKIKAVYLLLDLVVFLTIVAFVLYAILKE